jgi:hypothetical protein
MLAHGFSSPKNALIEAVSAQRQLVEPRAHAIVAVRLFPDVQIIVT